MEDYSHLAKVWPWSDQVLIKREQVLAEEAKPQSLDIKGKINARAAELTTSPESVLV